MPDIVLDYHRLSTPMDHPDLSMTKAKLELLHLHHKCSAISVNV